MRELSQRDDWILRPGERLLMSQRHRSRELRAVRRAADSAQSLFPGHVGVVHCPPCACHGDAAPLLRGGDGTRPVQRRERLQRRAHLRLALVCRPRPGGRGRRSGRGDARLWVTGRTSFSAARQADREAMADPFPEAGRRSSGQAKAASGGAASPVNGGRRWCRTRRTRAAVLRRARTMGSSLSPVQAPLRHIFWRLTVRPPVLLQMLPLRKHSFPPLPAPVPPETVG
jgi:hypothetical protein